MDDDAAEVLASARSRTATLAAAHRVLDWIMAQAPDDNTHQRLNSHHVTLVHHEGEKAPRAVVMPIESWQAVCRALATSLPADKKMPPRRKKGKASSEAATKA